MPGACWTCRHRTIQCDQAGIPCAKCQKAGLECFQTRPLRWVKGVAIRGKLRGRVLGENRKELIPAKQVLQSRSCRKSAPQLALQDPHVHDLDASSKFYLDYYNIRVAGLFILYDSESNPFRNLLTYAMDESTLRMCIVAVAARHFANTNRSFDNIEDVSSPQFTNGNLDALHFKRKAIKALSSSLNHLGPSQQDVIMPAILLLIFLDLLESGIDGWTYHLQGAEGLVNFSNTLSEPTVNDCINNGPGKTVGQTRRFVARQFSLVSTLGGALSGSKSRSQPCIDFDESRYKESIIRSFLGCPGFLLEAIRFFSDQRHLIEALVIDEETFIPGPVQDTLTMLELTANFDCLRWASESAQPRPSSTTACEIQNLSLLAQAYKTTALLYGNRVLSSFNPPTKIAVLDKAELVLQLLDAIDALYFEPTLFKCLLWPTFIAGLECQSDSEQEIVVRSLRMLWDLTSCLNVKNASNILHATWKRRGCCGDSIPDKSELRVMEQGWLLI